MGVHGAPTCRRSGCLQLAAGRSANACMPMSVNMPCAVPSAPRASAPTALAAQLLAIQQVRAGPFGPEAGAAEPDGFLAALPLGVLVVSEQRRDGT